jgi:hypothetical protein
LAGLAANAACEKFRWKFFFGPMSSRFPFPVPTLKAACDSKQVHFARRFEAVAVTPATIDAFQRDAKK